MLTRDPNNTFYRIPGQDPSILKTVEQMPKVPTLEEVFSTSIRTARDVVQGIINEPSEITEWTYFIQNTLMCSRNMLEVRKELMGKAFYMDPVLRNILAMRVMKYYQYLNKLFTGFHINLEKAMNRGGKYFKRVPRKNGKGWNYYYSEDDYKRSSSSHVNGDDARVSYLTNKIKNILMTNGGGNAGLFKNIVQKFGVGKVEKILKKEIRDGNVVLKGNKFSWVEKPEAKK